MYRVGASIGLLSKLLRALYPRSIAYLDIREKRELLIYIGERKTEQLESQLNLICDMFVPLDYEVVLFWEMHFGLIGVEETMEIGQIMMY
jgi:hypothetical protein